MTDKIRNWRPGDVATWADKRVLIVDVHGYGAGQTADVRWTASGVSGSRDEVSGHKRGIPSADLREV